MKFFKFDYIVKYVYSKVFGMINFDLLYILFVLFIVSVYVIIEI